MRTLMSIEWFVQMMNPVAARCEFEPGEARARRLASFWSTTSSNRTWLIQHSMIQNIISVIFISRTKHFNPGTGDSDFHIQLPASSLPTCSSFESPPYSRWLLEKIHLLHTWPRKNHSEWHGNESRRESPQSDQNWIRWGIRRLVLIICIPLAHHRHGSFCSSTNILVHPIQLMMNERGYGYSTCVSMRVMMIAKRIYESLQRNPCWSPGQCAPNCQETPGKE